MRLESAANLALIIQPKEVVQLLVNFLSNQPGRHVPQIQNETCAEYYEIRTDFRTIIELQSIWCVSNGRGI